jgi:hypothetical protein
MNQQKINSLVERYNAGEAGDEDMLLIESLIDKGSISLEDLDDVNYLTDKVAKLEAGSPSVSLDDSFYRMLRAEKSALQKFTWTSWFSFEKMPFSVAIASATFLVGLGIGYVIFTQNTGKTSEVDALSMEVRSLKEMMMLSLLEKESATERLKAVSMSRDLDEASIAVTKALIQTLNNDDNANVRLAALEALQPYGNNSDVRRELIRSISRQTSPLVQIALAELMASWQEKSSVKEFDKLLGDEKTPSEVKKQIRKSIEVLI